MISYEWQKKIYRFIWVHTSTTHNLLTHYVATKMYNFLWSQHFAYVCIRMSAVYKQSRHKRTTLYCMHNWFRSGMGFVFWDFVFIYLFLFYVKVFWDFFEKIGSYDNIKLWWWLIHIRVRQTKAYELTWELSYK